MRAWRLRREKETRMTDGMSRKDMLGTLRAYEALFDSLGFAVRLEPDEFYTGFSTDRGYVCIVRARRMDSPGRLLWEGYGRTQQAAREDMLRQAHSASGMPPAFSEAEAKMRIALVGEDAFQPACRKIEMFAGEFEEIYGRDR